MSLLRNAEVRRGLWALLAADAALSALGGVLLGWRAGLWTAASGLVLALVHLAVTRRRYGAIAALSRELDRILHDQGDWDLARFREGELAILQDEIAKMTLRLREQADALRRDRTRMADAMADLSHQLRTPLTSLRLVVSLLADDEPDEACRLAQVRELRSLLERMDWLLEALLKLSRLDAGAVTLASEETRVDAVLRRAAEAVAVPMELREQRLELRAGEETFVGDPAWTAEAVANILKNCMEHTPRGGVIRAEARQTAVYTELTISDTGPGIAPADLPRLFERFYRGAGAAAGTAGVGLALARTIVAAQGGAIKAANRREGGAVFTIRFYRGAV